ncbi:hypothetical protein [Hymenobacter sp. BRD67]|uniref:hypothetical protein n=1 Tax=Hymenobacter sp. BRD67 TaxID=2675877 RepID=UPI0015667FE4|nr:hypothetical protein [Hymenobacter sp. BRD67]QKG51327.1 hypothetical protein GKZ67_00455 [Hymenobacter sp. BRD67]
MALYCWNDSTLALGAGLHLDPLLLLLPAVLMGGLGLRERAPSYAGWLPYAAARPLYWLLVAASAGALSYALATANTPLLTAARTFSGQTLLAVGAAFFLYVLVNFGTLIRQRLRVYRVVFEPRRLPFYLVYILGIGSLFLYELRSNWPLLNLVQAGQYNQLGDLTRQQSEARPDDLPLALLAERYYAESGDVLDRFNRPAQLGRAALYRFRSQRQNELNALRRALLRGPDEKVSLHLNALLSEPTDFLDALEVLRQARRAAPRRFALTSDMAQLFTRSALTDSVAFYLDKAEQLKPGSYVSRTNQLAFLLSQGLGPAAQKLAASSPATPDEPALLANKQLVQLLTHAPAPLPALPAPAADLDAASFAQLYQTALLTIRAARPADCQHMVLALARLSARAGNEAYYEQLLFLQALLRHAAGQELAARQTLAPLTAGSTPTAGYYQYILGLWQLQQQQYATATAQFGRAVQSGFKEAVPAQLFTRFIIPLSPDSTLAFRRAMASVQDSAAKKFVNKLLYKVNEYEAEDGEVETARWLARKLTDLAQANQLELMANEVRRAEDWVKNKDRWALPQGSLLYTQAALAGLRHQPAVERKLYTRIVNETPFNETAVLAAARYFTAQKAYTDAYDALNKGLTENPASVPLRQAYVLAAADAGLADLGQSALGPLRPHLSPAAYANLLSQFAAHQAAHAAAAASFDQPPVPAR